MLTPSVLDFVRDCDFLVSELACCRQCASSSRHMIITDLPYWSIVLEFERVIAIIWMSSVIIYSCGISTDRGC